MLKRFIFLMFNTSWSFWTSNVMETRLSLLLSQLTPCLWWKFGFFLVNLVIGNTRKMYLVNNCWLNVYLFDLIYEDTNKHFITLNNSMTSEKLMTTNPMSCFILKKHVFSWFWGYKKGGADLVNKCWPNVDQTFFPCQKPDQVSPSQIFCQYLKNWRF